MKRKAALFPLLVTTLGIGFAGDLTLPARAEDPFLLLRQEMVAFR